jgi:small subunit ribosomal protein YMR-31
MIGGKSGKALGSVAAPEGEYFDRSELPRRFQPLVWEDVEIDAVMSGGASMVGKWN